ncbi:hypothetical protein [Clostridium sp. ZBS18]|uniref:hypothetical protein n=1 Tax=Clostridium sp. ZBS18 TaxID=2949967 RepID=UPI00207AD94D|nr:hypothetical protein [Clostridium sp. ZBS18]
MAKATHSKCTLCGDKFLTQEMIVRTGKKYCKECIIVKDKENEDWSILYEYIKELYNLEKLPILFVTQMNKYRKDEKCPLTSIGMYYTLKYYYEILENKIDKEKGLGIIPYYYDKAKAYYTKVFDTQDKINDFCFIEERKEIKTKRLDTYNKTKKEIPLEIWRIQDENI